MINPLEALKELGKQLMYYERYGHEESIAILKKDYQELLKRTAELSHKLGLTDPSSICSLYTYLYIRGYLSKEGNFAHSDDAKYPYTKGISGAIITSGLASNIHILKFLKDLLNYLEIETHEIIVEKEKIELGKIAFPIPGNLMKTSLVCIQNQQGLYYYDPTEVSFLIPIDESHITNITTHAHQEEELIYHYLYQKWMDNKQPIPVEDYMKIIERFNQAQALCRQLDSQLRQFLRDNNSLYCNMNKQIDKMKKKQLDFYIKEH